MNNSEPLFYKDGYLKEITTKVIAIEPQKKYDEVVVEQTIFYPEGGGQPGDRGTIDNFEVFDTQSNSNGEILHHVIKDHTLKVGDDVNLKLDWKHRYDYMQQHSAQHLLSGTLFKLLKVGTLSVHLGNEDFSIEVDANSLTEKELFDVEDEVNKAIRSSEEVWDSTHTPIEVKKFNLRREVKVTGDARIVSMGSFDKIACGGVHVKNISEIKHIQFLRSEKIRGNLRLFFTAGDRSIALIRANKKIVDEVGTILSSQSDNIVPNVEKLKIDLVDCRYHYNRKVTTLAKLLLEQKLKNNLAIFDATDWADDEYKAIGEVLLKVDKFAIVITRENQQQRLNWMVALKGLGDENQIYNQIKEQALPLIDAKGGGKAPLWQGIGQNKNNKEAFLAKCMTILKNIHIIE
ncbi:MAG: alanyl-tRNA editing protein [Sphaerochaetaceae bacterium]|jgi:alanyl-tRNA synthetase